MSSNGAATGPDTPGWSELLAKPRLPVTKVRRNDVPRRPGVYAWFRDGECMYLGRASDLRSRLGTHLGTSLDLSRSTLRSWVAVRELGLAREYTRRRPTVMAGEQVAIVNGWLRGCELAWMTSDTREDAAALEARLLAAYRPPVNVA